MGRWRHNFEAQHPRGEIFPHVASPPILLRVDIFCNPTLPSISPAHNAIASISCALGAPWRFSTLTIIRTLCAKVIAAPFGMETSSYLKSFGSFSHIKDNERGRRRYGNVGLCCGIGAKRHLQSIWSSLRDWRRNLTWKRTCVMPKPILKISKNSWTTRPLRYITPRYRVIGYGANALVA